MEQNRGVDSRAGRPLHCPPVRPEKGIQDMYETSDIRKGLKFQIDGVTDGDYTIDIIETTGIPMPAAMPAGLGLLGMLLGRRRA